MSTTRPPAYQRLAELLIGARVAMALRVVAAHQIADHLATGPHTAEALSRATGLPASTLRRLMRGLADMGSSRKPLRGALRIRTCPRICAPTRPRRCGR